MLNNIKRCLALFAVVALFVCCGASGGRDNYAGTFTDEFGNKFELREDGTGTIQFVGQNEVNDIIWHDGRKTYTPYSTIEYNGDVNYYYLRDGKMYRHRQDMEEGHCAITIVYDNE